MADTRNDENRKGQRDGKERLRRHFISQDFEQTTFLYDIIETGELLTTARTFDGVSALGANGPLRVLRAIEKIGGGPTLSDLARQLRMTRITARELALRAERAGLVEILPDPFDRRALQLLLTQRGRETLRRHRLPSSDWLYLVLNGLETPAMRAASHVLNVIRKRLVQLENERKNARRGRCR